MQVSIQLMFVVRQCPLNLVTLGGAAITGAYFGHSTGLIHMDHVWCSGYESSLLNCQRGANFNYFCSHSRTAGVRCSSEIAHNCGHGDIRLVDGEVDYKGRVEMCYNNIWGTVCHDNWDYRDAVVVCHQLGYSGQKLHKKNEQSQCKKSEFTMLLL